MPDDNGGYDINAMAESIGNDLFPSEEKTGTGAPVAGDTPPIAAPGSTAPVPPSPDEDKWRDMPKAWKAEKKTVWDRLLADKEAREYIHAREADVVRGFEQYSTGHRSWNELITPFQQVIAQHPQVNPVQVMQGLMKNHLALLGATPEQKKVMAQHLLKSYGVDLGLPGQTPPPALPPEVAGALQTVNQLRDEFGRFKADENARAVETNRKIVADFAAKPENKYFEEVTDDILHLLQTGAAPSLEKAYEMACWGNPVVRAKIIAETSQTPPPKPPLNVNGSGGTPPMKPKTGDDTIDLVMQKHYGPNWKNAH